MAEIILIGTTHIDHKGPERLEKMLTMFRPGIICLEDSQKGASSSWRSHLEAMRIWTETPWDLIYTPEQIARVKSELISSSYESWVPKIYKNGSGDIRLFCMGNELDEELSKDPQLDSKAREWIARQLASGKRISDLITPIEMSIKDFVKNGSEEAHQAYVDSKYDETSIKETVEMYGEILFRKMSVDRDKKFARIIRELGQEHPEKVILAQIGNMHLFGDYAESTYNLLKDLNPQRYKLKDADKF
jgi:hypothetical protein